LGFSDPEVAIRWLSLHPGRLLDEFVCVDPTEARIQELLADLEKIEQIRKNLSSPSPMSKRLRGSRISPRSNCVDKSRRPASKPSSGWFSKTLG